RRRAHAPGLRRLGEVRAVGAPERPPRPHLRHHRRVGGSMAVTEEPVRTRTVTRHFVTVNGRQVHYRRAGSGPPVILRHESPRSSVALTPYLEALAPRFTAIALDTAGYGLSEPLGIAQPSVEDYAADFGPTLDALGIDRCTIYGQHTG